MADITWDRAVEELTSRGGEFEIGTQLVRGVEQQVFSGAPRSMRDLFSVALLHGDRPYLLYEGESWTFADVAAQIAQIGSVLVEEYGVQPEDRVAIAMRNYPEWITSFGAIVSVGAVAVALNAWWLADELEYGISDSGATVVICDEQRAGLLAPLIESGRITVLVVRPEGTLPEGAIDLGAVLPKGALLPEVVIDTDSDAMILYTSGTTGNPKGAVSTHRAVLTSLLGFACRAAVVAKVQTADEAPDPPAEQGQGADPCFILCVPLFHVTGLVPVMLGTLVSGARLVIMHRWNAERALELIEQERVTQFVGVPTMSWELLESPEFERFDTSSLESVGGGGAPAPAELVRRVEESFEARPGIGYGMTETNALGPQNSGDDYLDRPTSVGRSPANMEMCVITSSGERAAPGELGEICFKGANLIRGYWNKPEATAEAITDGWLRSGDLGFIDADGFVYVADRVKDMVIRAGENIYCAEVEGVLYEHPSVFEAAVFGLAHERLGEEVAVAVVAKRGTEIDPSELQAFVAGRLARFKVPARVFVHAEQLPRNASGKILKRALRDAVQDHERASG